MKFVTAIDEAYYPAIVALSKSFKANAGNVSLACMVHGDDELASRVESLGVEVIHNPEITAEIPLTSRWPVRCDAMWSRLLVPELVDGPCAWIDADCVILQSLEPLAELNFSQPVAVADCSMPLMSFQVGNLDCMDSDSMFSGLMVFNTPEWKRVRVTERCFEAMNTRRDLDFRFAVQSVLSYVLRGNWHSVSYLWQVFANRGPLPAGTRVVHYVGGLPWRDDMQNLDIWKQYA